MDVRVEYAHDGRPSKTFRTMWRFMSGLMIGVGLLVVGCSYWLLAPYNLVSYSNPTGTVVGPTTVARGGTVAVHYAGYCNHGVDVRVERWLDRYGPDGRSITTSFEIPAILFYNSADVCLHDFTIAVPIPFYISPGPGLEKNLFRLRNVTTYKANPIRTVTVVSYSTSFTITTEPFPARTVQ